MVKAAHFCVGISVVKNNNTAKQLSFCPVGCDIHNAHRVQVMVEIVPVVEKCWEGTGDELVGHFG